MEDPENLDEIIELISSIKTMGEIFKLIDDTFPKWVLKILDGFSKDYALLDDNWTTLCNENNVNKAKIIIVSRIDFIDDDDKDNDKYKLVRLFSELLTKSGFVVRDFVHILPCPTCNLALPTENMYTIMQQMKVESIPSEYSKKCIGC